MDFLQFQQYRRSKFYHSNYGCVTNDHSNLQTEAISLVKENKEKRERQPNWTEAEKQLLLSLTRKHRAVLEHKGSDLLTVKRKSDVWDDIAVHMNAAGYSRSKERLRQQLGRIRAAEAKKTRNALYCVPNGDTPQRYSPNVISPNITKNWHSIETESEKKIELCQKRTENMPTPLIEQNLQLKIEKVEVLSSMEQQPFIESSSNCNGTEKALVAFKQPLDFANDMENEQPSTSKVAKNSLQNNNWGRVKQYRKLKLSSLSVCARLARSKAQCMRQIYLYRLAVERERYRAIRLQQKRDLILFRKDMQIQNLKLQILRKIDSNQRRSNRINI